MPEFDGLYEASDQGRVRSLDRTIEVNGRWGTMQRKLVGAVLAPLRHTGGYARVMLWKDGAAHQTYVHKVVMEAFVGRRPAGSQVAHANGNKQDNRLDNLRWATPAENQADRELHGTGRVGVKRRTRAVGRAMADVIRTTHARTGLSITKLAKQLHLPRTTVADVVNKRTWK